MPKIRAKKTILFLLIFFSLFSLAGIGFGQRTLEVEYPSIPGAPGITAGISLSELIRYIFIFSLGLGCLIAFAALVYGGFRYLTSIGNVAATADARDQILAAILGLLILFCSWLVLHTINPQLLTFREPELEKPPIPEMSPLSPAKKSTWSIDELPIGALINSEYRVEGKESQFYSNHQGVLHPERVERLKEVSKKTDEAVKALIPLMEDLERETKKLMDYAEDLKNDAGQLVIYAQNCSCNPPNCNACCCSGNSSCSGTCSCSGDPCPDRIRMENIRNSLFPSDRTAIRNQKPIVEEKARKVELFSQTIRAFVDKNNKVEDFIATNETEFRTLLSPQPHQKLIYEMRDLENTATSTVTLSNGFSFITPVLWAEIEYKPEKEEDDVESNKIYLRNALDRLISAENKMKDCSYMVGDLMGFNDFHEWKNKSASEMIEIEINHVKEDGLDILPGSDPSTLYCSREYGPAIVFTYQGTYCNGEIPIGETIDMAEDLGEKIYTEIVNVHNKGVSATNAAFYAVDVARDAIIEAEEEIKDAMGG